MPYLHLAILHEAKGEFAEAARAIEQVPVTAPESTITLGLRGLMIGLSGNRDAAQRIYEQLQTLKRTGETFIPATQVANAAIGVGDYDGAVAWFNEAVVERDPIINWIALYPFERHLHNHPGFRALVTETLKLKFPDEHGLHVRSA
jgi:tetratricopeptide (TPR) repeat protein